MTGLVRFTKLEKTTDFTAKAMKQRAGELGLVSLTLDSGSEYTKHEEIGISIFFAGPYCSSRRGANENANDLLWEYLPRMTNISTLAQEGLDDIVEKLNNRSRKRLGYKTLS